MSPDHSRRNFLKYAPGALFLLTAARTTNAQRPPTQGPAMNPGSGNSADATASPSNNRPGGGGGGSGQGPGPAQHSGDYQPPTISGPQDKHKNDPPRKPRKDLAADQKSLRDDVRQLVRDTQELKKAVEQGGPKQSLSAEMIGKTKEIEKLAHNIAALAKG